MPVKSAAESVGLKKNAESLFAWMGPRSLHNLRRQLDQMCSRSCRGRLRWADVCNKHLSLNNHNCSESLIEKAYLGGRGVSVLCNKTSGRAVYLVRGWPLCRIALPNFRGVGR
jgi:hypothetical protein